MRGGVFKLAVLYWARIGLSRRVLAACALALSLVSAFALIVLGLAGAAFFSMLVFTLVAALATAAVLHLVRCELHPLAETARLLDTGGHGNTSASAIDDAARMRANAEAMASRLEKLKRRWRRHPLTGLPLQEEFLQIATDDIDGGPRAVLLGLVRLANFDAMTAFDPIGADRVLGAFSRRLKDALDPSRTLAHIDRDCFAIWFRGVAPHKQSSAELQALSYVLSQEIKAGEFTVTPDVQIGSALYPIDSTEAANLLSRAFVSLARPQRTGDGGLAFFAPSSPEVTRRRFTLEQALRHAIEQQQLQLHYQPFVDTATGAMLGAEALLRWRHPQFGSVSPAEFVPILEDTGLIEEIGLWGMATACRQLRAWRDEGFNFKVALNISARQLREPLLGKMITRALAAHKLTPADLELELTETAAMEDAQRTSALFRELRDEGFGIAIDDFGSGYSSLGYLKNLPFTKLKIDREFVTHLDTRPGSRAICKALIELANGLGIAVLAEGAERFEEVETLRALGCTMVQGFYFAPAMPAAQLASVIGHADWRSMIHSPVHRQQAELRRCVRD